MPSVSTMKFTPTPGFVELVTRVHDVNQGMFDAAYSPPSKKDDLWDEFLFSLFLGGTHRGAQAAYAANTLRAHLSLDQARLASSDPTWSTNVLAKIDGTIKKLGNAPPDGLKRSVLEDVRSGISSLDLVNTLAGMSAFVENFDPRIPAKIRGDFDLEFNFVDASVGAGQIPGVGYAKFVIWLQDLNLAWTLTPPSGPVRWALNSTELGFNGTNPTQWGETEAANDIGNQARTEFGGLSACYRTLASELMPQIGSTLTALETQASAWVLGTTHGLLPAHSRARKRLTSQALLDYMNSQGFTVSQYVHRVLDIDRTMKLEQDLVARL